MQYPRADWKSVYRSPSCKRVFNTPDNTVLRKQKAIGAVVERHGLAVSNFSTQKLVQILQYLLKEGVFGSDIQARSVFPELFPPPATPQEPVVPAPPSPPNSIMGELMDSLDE